MKRKQDQASTLGVLRLQGRALLRGGRVCLLYQDTRVFAALLRWALAVSSCILIDLHQLDFHSWVRRSCHTHRIHFDW